MYMYKFIKKNDIAMAITKYDQFDFLIDIVPREEIKTTKKPVILTFFVAKTKILIGNINLSDKRRAIFDPSRRTRRSGDCANCSDDSAK